MAPSFFDYILREFCTLKFVIIFFQLLIVHRRSTYFPIARHCHRLRHAPLFYVERYGQARKDYRTQRRTSENV